ncbi:unnamed protein product [Rotaria magnacalcarata]|uniref:Uncharacterized protein n=2 Tax=Rotaria magnacalcarata TaxID=392030 RepID=A0A816B7J2_9BILA|nr:unnamed protein product [Rotaria magnacalcarata]CAF4132570.1 unnamed protein product [Rotaria magnacalcarata]
MRTLDDEDEIPVMRSSNKIFINADEQASLDGTKLNNFFAFTNPHCILSESMKVVTSRHGSVQDLKYINDISNILIDPTLFTNDQEEHIYQELNQTNHEMASSPTNIVNNNANLLDEWSFIMSKLKELLSNTRKMPLQMPRLSSNSAEFRHLKQLLTDMEMTTSSWTNPISQCRYVLQHSQDQTNQS